MSTRTTSLLIVTALVLVGVFAFYSSSQNPGNESQRPVQSTWHRFNEGIELARQQNKKVLIDVYTDWCVWCKKMDKEVYTDDRVGRILASRFVVVKLNAESTAALTFNGDQIDEATLARTMGATAYPTTVFLDANAKPITRIAGYLEPQEFGTVLTYIGEDYYKTKTYDEFKSSNQHGER